ncbi:MAG: HEAT repeat domain-containing protein [Elusimicrobiota bacterium]|jgi:HEAT repeat protein
MSIAGILGVFIFLPVMGQAAPIRTDEPLPALADVFLPDRSSPDPMNAPVSVTALRSPLPVPVRALALRYKRRTAVGPGGPRREPPEPQAASDLPVTLDMPEGVPEFEVLGESLRDAVSAPPTLEWFREAIRNPEPSQRIAAIEAFSYPGNIAAIPFVSAVLLNFDEESEVRVSAAHALGRIGAAQVRRFLAKGVVDADARVRFAAVLALGQMSGYGEVRMEEVLRNDPSWWVRYAAAAALGRAHKPGAAGWLKRAVRKDESWQVRFQAALALGELGTPEAVRALAGPLADAEPMVRAGAGMALGRAGGDKSAALLAQAVDAEADSGVHAVLSWALNRAQARDVAEE